VRGSVQMSRLKDCRQEELTFYSHLLPPLSNIPIWVACVQYQAACFILCLVISDLHVSCD